MRKFKISLLLCLIALNCSSSPLYFGEINESQKPLFQKGSKFAIFSFLMREISVSNSQGINWLGKHFSNDYQNLHTDITNEVAKNLKADFINPDKIKQLAIYKDGYFPLKTKYYLNYLKLPVISSKKEEEIMMRTFHRTGADFYITILVDHSIRKNIFLPIETNSTMQWHFYHKNAGLFYHAESKTSATAMPYNRTESLSSLKTSYISVVNETLNNNNQINLQKILKDLKKDFPIVEMKVQSNR